MAKISKTSIFIVAILSILTICFLHNWIRVLYGDNEFSFKAEVIFIILSLGLVILGYFIRKSQK